MNWPAFILFTGAIGSTFTLAGATIGGLHGTPARLMWVAFALCIIYTGIGVALL